MKLLFRLTAIVIALVVGATAMQAQSPPNPDALLALLPDEYDNEEVRELLNDLATTPLDINRATVTQLSQLPGFDSYFVHHLLLHRARIGSFTSIYQLKEVEGAPLQLLPLLAPYLTISTDTQHNSIRRHDLYLGSEIALGRVSSNLERVSNTLQYHRTHNEGINFIISGERDRGERVLLPLRSGGLDYISAALYYNTPNLSWVVGDYRLTAGQGLLLGMGRSYFSRLEISGLSNPSNLIIKPHRSFREYGFVRGGAVSVALGEHFSLSPFVGIEPLDARIDSNGTLQTLYTTGKHITEQQQQYRHTATRTIAGAQLGYNDKYLHLGLTALRYRTHKGDRLIQGAKALQGSHVSLEGAWHLGILRLTGEAVLGQHGKRAVTGIAQIRHDRLGSFAVSYRALDTLYYAPYAMPDAHFSNHHNEKGWSMLWQGEVAAYLQGTLYHDRYHSIAPDSRRSHENGSTTSLRLLYTPTSHQHTTLLLRYTTSNTQASRFTAQVTLQHGDTASNGVLTLMGCTSYSRDDGISYSAWVRLRVERSIVQSDLALQGFRAPIQGVRRVSAYLPHHYYVPQLRGSGIALMVRSRIAITSRGFLYLMAAHTLWHSRPKTTPTPLLDLVYTLRW